MSEYDKIYLLLMGTLVVGLCAGMAIGAYHRK